MTNKETIAVVYRVISAYPFYAKHITDEMVEDMIREWHEGLKNIPPNGVMEAVTMLITENQWMPTLAEVISKILDIQYGTEDDIIIALDRAISRSSLYIIFGEVTDEQRQGFERLTPFQKLIIQSPYEFNMWLTKDHEWKRERVRRIKREISFGRHQDYLNGKQPDVIGNGFNVFKALEDRKNGKDQ